MANHPQDHMDAHTVKATADQYDREDAIRFLEGAIAAVKRGDWPSAKGYSHGAHTIAVYMCKVQSH